MLCNFLFFIGHISERESERFSHTHTSWVDFPILLFPILSSRTFKNSFHLINESQRYPMENSLTENALIVLYLDDGHLNSYQQCNHIWSPFFHRRLVGCANLDGVTKKTQRKRFDLPSKSKINLLDLCQLRRADIATRSVHIVSIFSLWDPQDTFFMPVSRTGIHLLNLKAIWRNSFTSSVPKVSHPILWLSPGSQQMSETSNNISIFRLGSS